MGTYWSTPNEVSNEIEEIFDNFKKYGWKPDLHDHRDVIMTFDAVQQEQSIDLRSKCPPIYDQGQLGSCHDDQTEVLTKDGWKLFDNLTDQDELASVNIETRELIYEKPTRLIKLPYNGELICAEHKFLNFAVTPDHKMVVRKWNEQIRTLNDNYELIEAKDLGWYSGLMNNIIFKGKDEQVYVIKGIDHKRIANRSDREVDMKAWLRFLGIYLAEGTMCKDPGNYKIQLACVKERETTFIKDTLNKLGLNYLQLSDRITFDNKNIYKMLEDMGYKYVKAPFKYVPKFVFGLSPELIKQFLLGHFMGDGCEQNEHTTHYTSSEQLANDLQLLMFLSGGESHIYKREPRTSTMGDGRIVKGNFPEFRVSNCEKKTISLEKKDQVFTKPYEGFVYCAEVPTYHTLVTRRQNQILISGNCTGNAIAAAYQFDEMKQANSDNFVPSRLFIYYNERKMEGTTGSDSGAAIRDGIKTINTSGVCHETLWPYDITKFSIEPTQPCYLDAKTHKSLKYSRLKASRSQLKAALASGYPVVFGIVVYESMESPEVAKSGMVPMPSTGERPLGGHCILLVGYDDERQLWIFRNSWGESWGDKGYGYLPYKYLNSKLKLASDFWVVETVAKDTTSSE